MVVEVKSENKQHSCTMSIVFWPTLILILWLSIFGIIFVKSFHFSLKSHYLLSTYIITHRVSFGLKSGWFCIIYLLIHPSGTHISS
jgi:hypothetical protein